MSYTLSALLISLALFVGMLLLLELGRRMGARRLAHDPEGAKLGTSTVDGAVYALLGLLIAFTFSGAASRFDDRRHLIVEEGNHIGTAYLRLDLLAPATQPALRDLFRRYVDSRLEVYRKLHDTEAAKEALARSTKVQNEIWSMALAGARAEGAHGDAMKLLVPALNQMIDITSTRTLALQMHPPIVIFALLFILAMAGALFAGYGMAGSKSRSWIHMVGFAAAMAVAVNVIMDLEYPRFGLVRVDAFDQVLVDVREGMR